MLSYESLLKEIKQMMGEKNLISIAEQEVDTEEQTKTISLPTFKISEKWGKPGNEDRDALSSFLNNIQGTSLQEKVSNLENFVSGCEADCIAAKDVPEILGNLVFLDVLSSIIYDYNAKTAGFLWESLLAVLIKGVQETATGGRNTPIQDLIDADDNALSLKLIKGEGDVGGSLAGLNRAFEEFGQVTYIVVTKTNQPDTQLSFYRTVLTPQNAKSKIKTAKGGLQWRMSKDFYMEETLGSLSLGSPDKLRTIASQYTARLGEGVVIIFNSLDALTKNINLYFSDSSQSLSAGKAAQTAARILKQKVDQEF